MHKPIKIEMSFLQNGLTLRDFPQVNAPGHACKFSVPVLKFSPDTIQPLNIREAARGLLSHATSC